MLASVLLPQILLLVEKVRLVVLPPDIHLLGNVPHAPELLERLVAKEEPTMLGRLFLNELRYWRRHDR